MVLEYNPQCPHKKRGEVKRDDRTGGTCMEQLTLPSFGVAKMTESPRDQLGAIAGNLTVNFLPMKGPGMVLLPVT